MNYNEREADVNGQALIEPNKRNYLIPSKLTHPRNYIGPPWSIRKNSPQSLANPIPVWFLDIGKSPFTSGPSNTIFFRDHRKTVWIDTSKAVIRYQTRPPSLPFRFQNCFFTRSRPRCGWQASIRKRGDVSFPAFHSAFRR